MVRVEDTAAGTALIQRDEPPSVYLDHWALRKLSVAPTLRKRFITALKKLEGTLAISWLNLAEYSGVTDKPQSRAAEALFEGALPQVFFLDSNPSTVIERENALLGGGPASAPHADPDF